MKKLGEDGKFHPLTKDPRPWPEAHEVHGLVAAWKLRSWRLTDPNLGQIPGAKGNLTIVATDGNLGVFITQEGTPYLGHIERKEGGVVLQQGFDGKVEPLGTAARRAAKSKVKKESKKSKKATIKARIASELEDL
jgi:hypothetical protein